MNKSPEFKDYFKTLWRKKVLIVIVSCLCMSIVSIIDALKPSKYRTESKILITSPYEPSNMNLPSSPYSEELFNDLFHNGTFVSDVIDKLKEKYSQLNLTAKTLEEMVSIELLDKSNLIKVKVEGANSELLVDMARLAAEVYAKQFNYFQDSEYIETKNKIDSELEDFQKKLFDIEKDLRLLKTNINYQSTQNEHSNLTSQRAGYKTQLRDKKIYLDGIDARIQELKDQLKEEREARTPRQGVIDSINSQLKAQYVENDAKLAEYEDIVKIVDRLKADVNSQALEPRLADYNRQLEDRKVYLDGIKASIQELEDQLKDEKENPPPNHHVIDYLDSQLKSQYIERNSKLAEYEEMEQFADKLDKEIDSLNERLVHYDIESKRLERGYISVENELRNFESKANQVKLTAKSRQMTAKVIELPTEPKMIKSNFKRDVVLSGVVGFILAVIFIWLCLV